MTISVERTPVSVEASALEMAYEIETTGSACVESVVGPEWLEAAGRYVGEYLPLAGHELFIENDDATEAPFVRQVTEDPALRRFLADLTASACPQVVDSGAIDAQLRIVVGHDPVKPLWFHYDSTAISVVLPIVIPQAGPRTSGELLICPNRRPYRRFAVQNIVEKFVTQNDAYRRRFVRKLGDGGTAVPLVPGNAYVFWGYRSYHATLPCPDDSLRATLILHYGQLHSRSRSLAVATSIRRSMRRLGRQLSA